MQCALPQHTQFANRSLALPALPTRPRRTRRQWSQRPQASAAQLALSGGDPWAALRQLSNISSAVAVLAGAWWWTQQQEQQQPRTEPCPKCGGTGIVDCFCGRWSDNDVGCGTCHGSGKMVCNVCRGGGTAVPIAAKVMQPNANESKYRQLREASHAAPKPAGR